MNSRCPAPPGEESLGGEGSAPGRAPPGGSAVSVNARGFPASSAPLARPAGAGAGVGVKEGARPPPSPLPAPLGAFRAGCPGRKRRSRLPAAVRLFPPPLRGASFVSAAARLFPRGPAARSAVPAACRALGVFRERSAFSVRAAARSALAPWLALLSRPLPACRRAGSACVCVSDAAEV